jgi:hypothetical protein
MGHATTSKKVASKAGEALRSKKSSKATKSIAGSALANAAHKRRRGKKKR